MAQEGKYFIFNLNKTKNLEMSTQVIEINTDKSYLSNSTFSKHIFTFYNRINSEDFDYLYSQSILLSIFYYLDPIKTVY